MRRKAIVHLSSKIETDGEQRNEEGKKMEIKEEEDGDCLTITDSKLPPSLLEEEGMSMSNKLSSVSIHVHEPSLYDPLSLASLVRDVQGGGLVSLYLYSDEMDEAVHASFLLAGLHPESERKERGRAGGRTVRVLSARLKSHNDATAALTTAAVKIRPTVNVNVNDDDDDLLDEDDLLQSSTIAPPPTIDAKDRAAAAASAGDDCGGRKACDNCTCGRAELEAAASNPTHAGSVPTTLPPSSACGNCSKGDAFRCAGCPFLGKPAFQEGQEHLVLDLVDDL